VIALTFEQFIMRDRSSYRSIRSIRSPLLWLLVGLLCTIPLLAWLQWRWIGGIAEREEEHLRVTMRTSATYAAWKVNQRILALQQTFTAAGNTTNAETAQELAEMLRDWKEHSDSLLIQALYVVRTTPETQTQTVYRFDERTTQLIPSTDSTVLQLLAVETPLPVSRMSKGLQALMLPMLPKGIGEARFMVGKSPPERPAKSAFSSNDAPSERGMMLAAILGKFRPDMLMIMLDSTFVRHKLLPSLMRAQFQSVGYHWAVVERSNGQVLSVSDAHISPQMFAKADFTAPIGFVPPRTPGRLGRALASVAARLPLVLAAEQDSLTNRSSLLPAIHSLGRSSLLDSAMMSSLLGIAELRIVAAEGSIEREVALFRWRNLAVSFGVLFVLAGGLIVVMLAVVRSERLAQQQIQFVAGVSHELRTPIAVLHSASENLADGIVKTPEQAQRYGTVMKREIVRLMEMTERTLSFAGIQSGRRMFDLQPALLADIVTAYLRRNHDLLEQEGCTVLVQHDTTLPLIPLDSRAIDSVLDNVMSNAVKYSAVPHNDSDTPAATMTAVQARREIRITTRRVGNDVVLSVQDFGRGITPKDQKQVFEPFFRTAEALNAQVHGSGLGLSIVRHIVKQHGGSIRLESAVGRGTTFFVHLPIPPEQVLERA